MWGLDLNGISDMYESYETANLWSFITNTPEGLRVNFVKAEHSTFRWAGPEQAVITSYGHAVHTLHKSGHWVHADNPDGMTPNVPSFACITSGDFHVYCVVEMLLQVVNEWGVCRHILPQHTTCNGHAMHTLQDCAFLMQIVTALTPWHFATRRAFPDHGSILWHGGSAHKKVFVLVFTVWTELASFVVLCCFNPERHHESRPCRFTSLS